MNASIVAVRVAPVPKPSPPQADAPQAAIQSAANAADLSQSAGGPRDFARALDRASAKPSRKEDSAKPASGKSGGEALPQSGNGAPPAAVAPVAAPTGALSLPPLLPPANGAPVLPSTLDEVGDSGSGDTTPPVAGGAAGSSPVAGTSSADTSSVGTSSAGSAAPADDTTQAAQGAVFGPAMTDLSSTASDPAPASSTPATAASATPPSGGAPPAASTAAVSSKSQSDAAPAPATAAPTNSKSAPVIKGAASAGTPGSASTPAVTSGGGRADSQTPSPSAAQTQPTANAASAASASPAGSPLAGSALMNLALTEGSDATGTAASALQAATAAASATSQPAADAAAATASPVTALSIFLPSSNGGSASQTAKTAEIGSSSAVSLGSGLDAHGHGGAGDSGSDTGTGTGSGSLASGNGTAALQQLSTSAAARSSDAAPVPTMRVHADVDSSDFPQGVADQVSLAVDNGWSSAKLSVNPPQLGPIELQIAVQGAHAQVAMSTHSAVTREALESSVPKLRDMLNSQGFTQVSVDISQRSFQERSTPAQPYRWTSGGVRETTPVSSSSAPVARTPLGMLDTYA
jgi:flagellar hook-length control protein FliK